MRKILSFFLLLFILSGCNNANNFKDIDYVYNIKCDEISYQIDVTEYSKEYISLKVNVNSEEENQYPFYVLSNEFISYVEVNGVKYSNLKWGKYLGEINVTNEIVVKCYFTEKGQKKFNLKYYVNIDSSITTLILQKMEKIHYIDIQL
ncbi:MAG: lipoprotein [Bacilli bacterium]|nr:lipoprotein [Bacilli bacterium]MBR2892203.1 lipoprotein [Bacilli bacterium]